MMQEKKLENAKRFFYICTSKNTTKPQKPLAELSVSLNILDSKYYSSSDSLHTISVIYKPKESQHTHMSAGKNSKTHKTFFLSMYRPKLKNITNNNTFKLLVESTK